MGVSKSDATAYSWGGDALTSEKWRISSPSNPTQSNPTQPTTTIVYVYRYSKCGQSSMSGMSKSPVGSRSACVRTSVIVLLKLPVSLLTQSISYFYHWAVQSIRESISSEEGDASSPASNLYIYCHYRLYEFEGR